MKDLETSIWGQSDTYGSGPIQGRTWNRELYAAWYAAWSAKALKEGAHGVS